MQRGTQLGGGGGSGRRHRKFTKNTGNFCKTSKTTQFELMEHALGNARG